jgi:nicotinamidase-related amidase
MENETALLVMDMQAGIVSRLTDATTVLANARKAIAAAGSKKIPVIYVVVGFRQGAPEINPKNKIFAEAKSRFSNANMQEYMTVHRDIAPNEGELTVVKRRISAFTGSDLEVVLRSFGIGHLVLMGIATSGVVLSTVREASDKDYQLTVLADACGDADEEVHRVLTTKVFPRQADVLTTDEWIKQ